MSEEKLKNDIKKKQVGNLYLFYGIEEYLKRNYTDYIADSILENDFRLLNKTVYEGKTEPLSIINNCETLPVFSDRRMVVVKDSGLFRGKVKTDTAEKTGKSNKVKSDDHFALFLQNVPSHVCLIFIEKEIDRRIKYVDLIKKNGLIVEFNFRKPWELVKWVKKMVRANNHEIDENTAAELVEYCEPGMDDILNEIVKLCAYSGDRKRITIDDIKKVCTKSVKSRIFDLTDAVAAGQCSRALALLNDMAAIKEPMPKVMYMITRQFRQLLQIKLMSREGAVQAEIVRQLKINPYIAGKVVKQASSFSIDKLERAVAASADMDLKVKSGKIQDKAAVELLIIGITS